MVVRPIDLVVWRSLTPLPFQRIAFLSVAIAACFASGCESKDVTKPSPSSSPQETEVPELTEDFMVRALSAFKSHLEQDSNLLEIHVTGSAFSVHLQTKEDLETTDGSSTIFAGSLVQLDYVETKREDGQPPIGKIVGPRRIEAHGKGEVKDNLYPFSEVNLRAMARAFRVAVLAVDPIDGKVEKLIVRRNLPFGERVRGRIYVYSPRMGGSVDVNENGTPLKR